MRPPFYTRKRGRNRIQRFQSGGHEHRAGVTRGVKPGARKCRTCKQPGHNAATCTQPKRSEQPAQGAPEQPAQGAPSAFSSVFGPVADEYM